MRDLRFNKKKLIKNETSYRLDLNSNWPHETDFNKMKGPVWKIRQPLMVRNHITLHVDVNPCFIP